jgi:hypothetical protein
MTTEFLQAMGVLKKLGATEAWTENRDGWIELHWWRPFGTVGGGRGRLRENRTMNFFLDEPEPGRAPGSE